MRHPKERSRHLDGQHIVHLVPLCSYAAFETIISSRAFAYNAPFVGNAKAPMIMFLYQGCRPLGTRVISRYGIKIQMHHSALLQGRLFEQSIHVDVYEYK